MNLSIQQAIYAIGLATSVTTAIFWGAYLLGKLVGRVDTLETRVNEHERHISRFMDAGV